MKRIKPTHFIVDCPKSGGHYGPSSYKYLSPEHYIGVKFVWKITKTNIPLVDRMKYRQPVPQSANTEQLWPVNIIQ